MSQADTDIARVEDADIDLLFVEDDADDVMIVRRALERAPIKVNTQVFHDGRAALDHLDTSAGRNGDGRISLVLLDLNMPVMDGHEFLRRLRQDERFKALPVVVLTTSRDQAVIQRAYRDGANAVISKADTLEGMTSVVDVIVRFWFQTSQRFLFG